MPLDALIFDLDGTLLDSNGLHARSWRDALASEGFGLPADRVAVEIGKGGAHLMAALIGEAAAEQHGDALRPAHEEGYQALLKQEPPPVYDGVGRLFAALRERGLKTAVATASQKDNLEKALDAAGLDLFALADVVVTDDDVDESKPAPDVVSAAVEKLGLAPSQCAFVGDTPYDAAAGRRAGVVTIGVATGVHDAAALRRGGARLVYAEVGEILDDLDDALRRCAPGPERLTAERLDHLMTAALEMASTALERGEVPIGAVVARTDGTLLARAHNTRRATDDRTAHAEMEALRAAAGQLDDVRDLVLVTTLEPCVMCYGAAMTAGVDTVVYALDAPPNGGPERCTPPDAPGFVMPRLVGGVKADASRRLLGKWLDDHPDDAFVRAVVE